jgi:chromosome segregation ATPase
MNRLKQIGLALNLLLGILVSQTALSQDGALVQRLTNSLENCDRSDAFKSSLIADFKVQKKEAKELETNLRAQISTLTIDNGNFRKDNDVLKGNNEQLTKDLMTSTAKVKDKESEIVILNAKLFKRPIIWGGVGIVIGVLIKALIIK